MDFQATVSAMVYSFAREWEGRWSATDARWNEVVRFVLDQHARMPDYLRFPLKCLTLAFDAAAIPFTGRAFHSLPHERRWRLIQRWKRLPIGPCSDLMRFYETLAVFGWSTLADEQ